MFLDSLYLALSFHSGSKLLLHHQCSTHVVAFQKFFQENWEDFHLQPTHNFEFFQNLADFFQLEHSQISSKFITVYFYCLFLVSFSKDLSKEIEVLGEFLISGLRYFRTLGINFSFCLTRDLSLLTKFGGSIEIVSNQKALSIDHFGE